MNARLRNLIHDSRVAVELGVYDTCNGDRELEKLAELVALECAAVCYNSNIPHGDIHASNILYEFDIDGARAMK